MAEIKRRTHALHLLRRFPFLFSTARAIYRAARHVPQQVLRRLLPSTPTFGLPRGFYSGVEQLRSGTREGRIVLEGQNPPAFGEQSLVRRSGLNQDRNQPWPIFWLREQNAHLTGPTLCPRDAQGRLLAESTFSPVGNRGDEPAWWHFASPPQLRLTGNVTSIVSRWSTQNYWHWPMDAISRLALLPEFPADTRILVPPLLPWMTWFLREMGLEGRWIETSATSISVENYFFTVPSSMTGCYNPFAIRFLRDTFLPKQTSLGATPRRLYLIREGLTRALHNEGEVREFFRRRGWALLAPETRTIPEQIEIFAHAEGVVALHGSALANLLWCSPGCRVLEFAPDNFLAGPFEIVARILDLRHDFMICPGDHRTHIHVDLAGLERKLTALGV